MQSLDDIFYVEFQRMMKQLKAVSSPLNINEIVIPPDVLGSCYVNPYEMVYINGIDDEYYSKLNGSCACLWTRPDLKRRKFDSKGEYIIKNDQYVLEDVILHHNCLALVSDRPIGVKTKYKSKEGFDYVDIVPWQEGSGKVNRFVYVIPRKYCYKVNQSAIVLSLHKMTRDFYSGLGIALTSGNVIHMYVIPYSPNKRNTSHRIVSTGYNPDDLFDLGGNLYKSWVNMGYAFNPEVCEVMLTNKDISNVASQEYEGVLDSYQFCSDVAMDKITSGEEDMSMLDDDVALDTLASNISETSEF